MGELTGYTSSMHLILFDIDGTLINGHGMGRLALERTFHELFARSPETHPGVREVFFAGNTDRVIVAEMAVALGIASAEFAARRGEFDTAYLRHLRMTVAETEGKIPCPGIPELLTRLKANPAFHLGLVTGNIEPGARIKLDPFGLNPFFGWGGFGDESDRRVDLAALAWSRGREAAGTDIPAHAVALIGDTVPDIEAARAHGFLAVGVTTGWEPAEILTAAGADRVFPDLSPDHGFEAWLFERWGLPGG